MIYIFTYVLHDPMEVSIHSVHSVHLFTHIENLNKNKMFALNYLTLY